MPINNVTKILLSLCRCANLTFRGHTAENYKNRLPHNSNRTNNANERVSGQYTYSA